MKKTLNIVAIVLGLGLLVVAFIYWLTPANALPVYFPGYSAALATPHIKHGIAAFVVALACFSYAWFNSAKSK